MADDRRRLEGNTLRPAGQLDPWAVSVRYGRRLAQHSKDRYILIMLISAALKPSQPTLFDRDEFIPLYEHGVLLHGRVRTAIGAYYEQLTTELVSGVRHKTDCRCDYCPDISFSGEYAEVKACGRSNKMLVYAGRLIKDQKFANAGYKLSYYVWYHNVETKHCHTVAQLKDALRRNTQGFAVVPIDDLVAICSQLSQVKLNSKYGHSDSNPTYGSGYLVARELLSGYFQRVD